MSAAIVIPARYAAERFPGKLLALLGGVPVIVHTVRAARRARLAREVIVACDDPRIAHVIEREGGRAILVSEPCASGSDRVARVAASLDVDVVVNVQGDEPFLDPGVIDALLECMHAERVDVCTAMTRCLSEEEARSPNVVKVVCRADGHALYFSRSVVPYPRRSAPLPFKHLGIYAYRAEFLRSMAALPPSGLEHAEGLEQLRILEAGLPLRVIETQHHAIGIDTPDDLARAEALLEARTHDTGRALRAD